MVIFQKTLDWKNSELQGIIMSRVDNIKIRHGKRWNSIYFCSSKFTYKKDDRQDLYLK